LAFGFIFSVLPMTKISETELKQILDDIVRDKESIVRHNPIGTPEEVLLWMLLNTLVVYLSLNELETPCFNGRPDAATYREAIEFVLRGRKSVEFDAAPLLDKLRDE
jgi:hypothetical protein